VQEESGTDGYRGEGITSVVNQVGEKRHGTGKHEDHDLQSRGHTEHSEADQHRLDARP
jgi:hypothetical protein